MAKEKEDKKEIVKCVKCGTKLFVIEISENIAFFSSVARCAKCNMVTKHNIDWKPKRG